MTTNLVLPHKTLLAIHLERLQILLLQLGFFGHYTKEQTKEVLKLPGDFLVRFSTSSGAGTYTLSAMNEDKQVGHWRVFSHKLDPRVPPVFDIDGRKFKSLYDIVRAHSQEPLQSTDRLFKEVFLKTPADRRGII